ncbi:AGAP013210-PA [Anopheles gambiae str. PEST]|uniref:AGAP013210-PA n=1 Tax=Anopheles gambiae TaxID=7165 RepID=F5HJI0_ANOGA|nr:AGAP013210-PA [Anopheles gambiae str. PEST]
MSDGMSPSNVIYVTRSFGVIFEEYVVDQGRNLTLRCDSKHPVRWVREGRREDVRQFQGRTEPNVQMSIGRTVCSKMGRPHTVSHTEPGTYTDTVHTCNDATARNMRAVRAVIEGLLKIMRKMRESSNETELPWETIDPRHISPNARQLEIYHLIPNTTYEFRIWGNNQLGAGEIVTILATTQPRMEEKDLVRRIMIDAKNFDTRVWIAAVGIVMGTLVILSLGTCIVLYKECREPAANDKDEELDSLELVPNIILNPGFCDSDDQGQNPLAPPIPRTLPYNRYRTGGPHDGRGRPVDDEDDEDDDEDDEEPMTFSRRMSIFFTGNTIKRI